ncbi:MAG: phosphatase PAP2 family protein [Deltaproteobacteria bacterium]|uniref:Phosphatase PAP2 family protein n=1 Tax=Candidatus Zymogenus saltonus TaxID=2844893 RepID=A0A9D8KGP9_9DELT|nr:phosphatase PAP2 family protein [Candidatus Zymogenus saltonus]
MYHSDLTDASMFVITQFGAGLATAALIGVPLFFYDKENFLRRFFVIVLAVLLGGAVVEIIKDCISCPRPVVDLMGLIATGTVKVNLFIEDPRHLSFPSGHTQLAFGAAVALIWYHRGWYTAPLFVLAALVGFSRIYLGVHFPLDVICGALIGIIISIIVCWGVDKIISRFFVAG